MENFIYQNFTLSGLIIPVVLMIICSFLRVQDCLKSKRGLLISIIISSSVLSINWVFAIALFFGFSLLGIYLESIMPFVPLYLYWAYFILSLVSFLYLFSVFFKFGNKFYTNFRDEGILSFKANDTWY
jgi:hypothetical protein